MSEPQQSRAAQLRAEFDRAFALPHAPAAPAQLDLLLIRVGGHPYALPLSQVMALHVDRTLTEAPSPRRELLGLVGLRGVVTPVYSLSLLLGYEVREAARFLVQVDVASPFALSFEHFEQHARVAATALAPVARDGEGARGSARGSISLGASPVTVLNLETIFQLATGAGREANQPRVRQERP